MAEQSRPPRFSRLPPENTDRRNRYPDRIFYPSAGSVHHSIEFAFRGYRGYLDTSCNNNNHHVAESATSDIETRDLFKELPMASDDEENANGYTFPRCSANGGQNWPISDLNWYVEYSQPSNNPFVSNRNRNLHAAYALGSRASSSLPHTLTSRDLSDEWANAPEFFPHYSTVNVATVQGSYPTDNTGATASGRSSGVCGVCAAPLTPADKYKRKTHRRLCQQLNDHSAEVTGAALERSKDKTCGICFEVIMEKPVGERRFGILTMCNHCFCLECIRKWRQARTFENKVVKSCPECRITSDFVCPSVFWVDTKEEKDSLIEKYKNALSEKHCKYFKQGRGVCPFGNKCFYLHALPNGTKTDVGPPPRRRRPQIRPVEDLDLNDMLQQIILWDIHDEHEHHWLYSYTNDIEELASFFSDSDESEWSDYDFI